MGHIHNEGLDDIPFPMKIRNELVNSARVQPHHVLPQSGWISYPISRETGTNYQKDNVKLNYMFAKFIRE